MRSICSEEENLTKVFGLPSVGRLGMAFPLKIRELSHESFVAFLVAFDGRRRAHIPFIKISYVLMGLFSGKDLDEWEEQHALRSRPRKRRKHAELQKKKTYITISNFTSRGRMLARAACTAQ